MKNALVLIFTLLLSLFLVAQEIKVKELSMKDGLSQGMIFDILQTSDGFMWFATKDGLNRYDGYNFKVYTHDISNPYSISGNVITKLFEDSKGRLWIATQNNELNLFDKKTERFYHYNRPMKNIGLRKDVIEKIVEDNQGNIIITGNNSGIFKLRVDIPATLDLADLSPFITFQFFGMPVNKGKNKIIFLKRTKQDDFLFGGTNGLFSFKDSITQIKTSIPPQYLKGGFKLFLEISDNHFLIGTPLAFYMWNRTTDSFKLLSKRVKKDYWSDSKVICNKDKKGRIWIQINNRELFWLKSQDLLNGTYNPQKIHTIDQGRFSAIYEDQTHQVWIGTNGYGLLRYNPFNEDFNSTFPKQSLVGIFKDSQQRIWMGGYDDGGFKLTTKDVKQQNNFSKIQEIIQSINFVIEDNNKDIWIFGVAENLQIIKLLRCNSSLKILEKHEYEHGRESHFLKGTFSHNNRFLWIGLGLGKILRFDKMKEKTEFITYKSQGKTSSFSTIIALECDLKNNIWVGDPSGLTKIEKAASDRPEYIYYEANKNGKALRSGHILSIEEDPISPKDFLWVGTKGGGLHKLNKSEGTFENLTEKDGLPNNVIYSILSHKDKLWMSTNKGLSEFNIKEKSFRNYTMDNGLQENEFNTNAYHKSQDGEFFFGGINGLNRFYPDSISSNNIPASITLTNLEVNNHIITPQDTTGILRQPIEHHKAIELTHNQNIISLEFAVLDFTSKSENEYKYMMEGVNKDWVFSKENKAYYTNLSAGSYTFKVNGRNSNGAWHTEGISLEIIVHPPWWASNIAYAFYFISILITSYLIIRFQINRWKLKKQLAFEQKESERKEELDKMKTQFFSNITHEFRTPLTLIIEPIKQLIQDYNDPVIVHKLSLVEKNSSQLLHLVNQLLDLSKLESKKMQIELHQGDILDSIIPIVQSFEFLAQRKNIELRLNTPLKINAFDFDKKKIEKILYNLISNAIKYTPQGGKVEVTAYIKEGSFKLKIKDSGVGIPEHLQESIFKRFFQVDGTHTREAQGTGIGLSLVRELVQLMNGKIKVKSTEGKGSLFSVNIPIQTQQEKNADISGNALLESIILSHTEMNNHKADNNPNSAAIDAEDLVLVIEDNDELREFIRQSIQGRYQVITAANGEEGILQAIKHLPNIIISDLMMPKKDGFQVCEILKTDERTSHIPIILLTAKTAMESKLKGLQQGADAYMAKPFNTQELLIRIHNLVKIRKELSLKFQEAKGKEAENILSNIDQLFMNRLNHIFEKNIANEEFTVKDVGEKLKMSRSQLHRKVKALTNQSVSEYLRGYRLETAYQILKNKDMNINEVMEKVGFKHQSYFAKIFKERFGISPSKVKLKEKE